MRGLFPRNVLQGCSAASNQKRERETGMSQRLTQIANWAEHAAQAKWCVLTLAENCDVSPSSLERHFEKVMGQCPREWMNAERMRRACGKLKRGERIKDIAAHLCYGHPRNFTRAFTEHFGYNPREHPDLPPPTSAPE
jgi:AraC-like DNA-binding protein